MQTRGNQTSSVIEAQLVDNEKTSYMLKQSQYSEALDHKKLMGKYYI